MRFLSKHRKLEMEIAGERRWKGPGARRIGRTKGRLRRMEWIQKSRRNSEKSC
jgi:hypothetical protein